MNEIVSNLLVYGGLPEDWILLGSLRISAKILEKIRTEFQRGTVADTRIPFGEKIF